MYWARPLPAAGTTAPPRLDRLASSFDTTRLSLRFVERRDLPDLTVINADDETTRFLGHHSWRSSDDAETWYRDVVDAYEAGRSRHFALVAGGRPVAGHDTNDGRVIGVAVLFNFDPVASRAELGYMLGPRDRGAGLMHEALCALLSRAFTDLDLRRIEAFVDPRNAASGRTLRSLGFAYEGRLRARGVLKGEVVDSDAYGMLQGEWRPTIDRR